MAEDDWAFASNSLPEASVKRGVTAGLTPPNGGGDFIFGFNSIQVVDGAVVVLCDVTDFAPIQPPGSKGGGSIRAAIKRVGAGNDHWSGFLFLCAGGNDVSDNAYMLGLEDDYPYRITLRKGALSDGNQAVADDTGLLRSSVTTYTPDTWHHLRLDAVVNDNGDVVLSAWENAVASNDVTSPVWTRISFNDSVGDYYVDDALGITSGSLPYTSGYIGFGFQTEDTARRIYVDHVECIRQL